MKSLEKSEYFRLKRLCLRYDDMKNYYIFYKEGVRTSNTLYKDITYRYASRRLMYEFLLKSIIQSAKIAR